MISEAAKRELLTAAEVAAVFGVDPTAIAPRRAAAVLHRLAPVERHANPVQGHVKAMPTKVTR
jgi:hypothetical protein